MNKINWVGLVEISILGIVILFMGTILCKGFVEGLLQNNIEKATRSNASSSYYLAEYAQSQLLQANLVIKSLATPQSMTAQQYNFTFNGSSGVILVINRLGEIILRGKIIATDSELGNLIITAAQHNQSQ